MDALTLIGKIQKFLEKEYYDALIEKINRGKQVLAVDFQKLALFDASIADYFLDYPDDFLKGAEYAVEQMSVNNTIKNFKLVVRQLPLKKINVTEIRAKHFNKLIKIEGILVKKSVKQILSSQKFSCPSCGNNYVINKSSSKLEKPIMCSCRSKQKSNLIDNVVHDSVLLSISSEGETLSGVIPETIWVDCGMDKKGNEISKVVVTGILRMDLNDKTGTAEIEKHLDVLDIKVQNSNSKSNDVEQLLNATSPYQFEELISLIFKKKGYSTKTTPKSGDFGTDVLASRGEEIIAIQCKKHRKEMKVANTTIQKALGSAHAPYNANKVIIVTTAHDFTDAARKQVKESKISVELWNYDRLIAEIMSTLTNSDEGWSLINEIEEREMKEKTKISDCSFDPTIKDINSKNLLLAKEVINNLQSELGEYIPLNRIVTEMESRGINQTDTLDLITRLKRSGDIFEPKKEFISKI